MPQTLKQFYTRNSAIADKLCDASRGQLIDYIWFPITVL